ncbi:MAG: YqgE/AlgH family protein [Bacteroidota bacterium]
MSKKKSNRPKPGIFIPEVGKLLISEPFTSDYFFTRSVILLAGHDDEGSFGVILNKPTGIKINDLLKDFPDFKATVNIGGPVEKDSIFFIHTAGDLIEDSVPINTGISFGGSFDSLVENIQLKKLLPSQIRFFIGYSGWGPKQLNQEISRQSWIVANQRADYIMKKKTESLWKEILKQMKNEYSEWVNYPVDPQLN